MEVIDNIQSKVQLFISCQKLPRMDLLSKSDPFIVVYMKNIDDLNWNEIFRTETIWNNEDPEFPDHIVINFRFEAVQKLRFEVYDRDTKDSNLSNQDYIGSFETTASRIMGSRGNTVAATLVNERKRLSRPGQITVKGKEISSNVDILDFKFSAESVDRKNWFGFGRSDPFYEIFQMQSDGSFLKVFTSEKIMSNLNPKWQRQNVPIQRICNGDLTVPLRITVYDWERNGSHQYIGEFETSVEGLCAAKKFPIINLQKKEKNSSYINSGTFIVEHVEIRKRYSFLEYIQGGLELNLMVAIDFTASNGDPSNSRSLHYTKNWNANDIQVMNEYQKAILSVGQILEDYDTDKKIPVYGFGGQYKGRTSHCFPLNFNDDDPEVDRVEGIMEAYSTAVKKVSLSGPTYFGPILAEAVKCAQEAVEKGEYNYFILLILTDGQIFDMDESIKQICLGAALPLSIIIAGVGNADFTNMDTLDGDDVRLSHRGVPAERDIVQFVPMREFKNKSYTALAEATLEELPGQITDYFGNRNMKPRTPKELSKHQIEMIQQSQRRLDIVPTAEIVKD